MTTGKLCVTAFLLGMPALAAAQPSVSVDVGVNVGVDAYDTVAPGDPVESVDVFYDQLSPYGVWIDEPDVGRVFLPDTADFVPYTTGHWEYTNLGFVWISTEPFAWATTHYGRWAYSRAYGRWYWLPDTQWGPAWVEWRQTGTDFGWAPLAPEIVVRAGWQPPAESWHYCSAEHVLDANLVRYYEPRERVVEIHRQARPLEHYSTISNVRVAVGPPAAALREHRVAIHRVKVEPRTVGRWTPAEAHAQVARASEHRATFEVQNQQRIDRNARVHTAQVKVIEAHPRIKAQVTARVQGGGAHPAEPGRGQPARVEPNRGEPNRGEPPRTEPRSSEHAPAPREQRPEHAPPQQHEAKPPVAAPPAQRDSEQRRPEHAPPQHEAKPPAAPHEQRPEHAPPPQHEAKPPAAPHEQRPEHAPPQQHEAKPPIAAPPAQRAPEQGRDQHRPEQAAPTPPAPARAPEPTRRAPEPEHAQPPRAESAHGAERKQPERPERKESERKPENKDDRKEPDRH